MTTAVTIIVAVIGSTALGTFLQFLITRHDNKKNVNKKLEILEKDTLRTQILMLILLMPHEKQAILTASKHYFGDLHGNWWLTGLFNEWCEKNNENPEWFDKNG